MELITEFEKIADTFMSKGRAKKAFMNKEDVDKLEYMLPTFFKRATIDEYWSQDKIGSILDVPVLVGVLSKNKIKLCW